MIPIQYSARTHTLALLTEKKMIIPRFLDLCSSQSFFSREYLRHETVENMKSTRQHNIPDTEYVPINVKMSGVK